MSAGLSFRLFGSLEVADAAGRLLDPGTRKQRAVLTMLALEPGRVVSLDRLIDELWAGEPPSGATRTLQAYISHLRRVLEPERRPRTPPQILLTREPGYLLAVAPGQIDLARFTAGVEEGRRALARGEHDRTRRALERALELWRGEPLGEFADQEFAQPVVARLRELRDAAVEDRLQARLALGEAGACVPDLESLTEAHPYRERAWGLLVLALYRAGRQAEALAALRRIRARLADDLGIEPGPELRRLEQAVFEQAPELEVPAAPPYGGGGAAEPGTVASDGLRQLAPAPVSGPAAPGSAEVEPGGAGPAGIGPAGLGAAGAASPASAGIGPAGAGGAAQVAGQRLIAREAQLRLVGERLAEARRGRGGVLLVTGEAGIGKSRLAQAAADEALSRGFQVAWGRCLDGMATAFWPWRQVLRERGGSAADLLTEVRPAPVQDPDAALLELYERVVAALTGGGPLLVVVEDLHWADASSLRLLAFAAGELARHPVVVMATLRPEPGAHPRQLRDTLGALAGQPTTERVRLDPFGPAEVASYLRLRHVPEEPGLVGALLERTGGNPFYLGEVLRLRDSEGGRPVHDGRGGLPAEVPAGARDVIERRAARLPEETLQLLRVAAVIGRDVEIDLLETVIGVAAEQVMSLLEPAVATGLLTETPGGFDYRFSHALVRDALLGGLGRLERARLHLRAGQALEGMPGAEPVRLARHFAAAAKVGGAADAVRHACQAARLAGAQLAYAEAVELWELALGCLPPGEKADRCAVLTELGQARRTVGDAAGAHRDMDEAIELAVRAGDRQALIAAVTVFGGLAVWHWRSYGVVDHEMVAVLEDLLAGPLDDAQRAVLLGTLGLELYYGPRRAEGERHAIEAVEIARRLGDHELLTRALNNYLLVSWVAGRNAERLRAAEEMLAIPELPRAAELVARVFRMACLLRSGDLAEWDRDLARCQRLLDEVRRPELEPMVRIAETSRRTLEGRWAEVESLITRFGEMKFGSTVWGPEFRHLVMAFTCKRGQGRVPEILDELVAAAEDRSLVPLRPVAVLAALEGGRPDLARELVARWGTEIREDWVADFLTPVWGLVAARLGVPDPEELYGRLLPYADQLIVCGTGTAGWGSTHMVLAELAARLGRTSQAREHARAAVETHRRLGFTYLAEQSLELLSQLE
ncbi:BTAD domain-containing putative transcriptional regulator [Streptosporangium sp. CA-135522]|uniref:BTAD domain-containing putative transcriptional regulator n=1 Tax=Streptosporangium sp. CA-135522 TaxID=3240072 RepID=UPI003D94A7D8